MTATRRKAAAGEGGTPSQLIGTAEFCRLLDNLSRQTFQVWKALGKIGPKRVNKYGHPRWGRAEVMAWLREKDGKGELFDAATWPARWKAIRG